MTETVVSADDADCPSGGPPTASIPHPYVAVDPDGEITAVNDRLTDRVDIDRHQRLAQQHGVQGVPTMVVFSGGRPDERLVGVKRVAQLTSVIESVQ